jgi:hypothetical protein
MGLISDGISRYSLQQKMSRNNRDIFVFISIGAN